MYFFVTFREVESRITPINSIVVAYLVLVTVIIITMPLREEESLIQSFQAGRRYYILLLAFVIDDNIYYSNSTRFVKRLVCFLGIYYTTVAAVNYISPSLVEDLLPGLRNGADNNKGVLTRNYITENTGILFAHFSFVLKGLEFLLDSNKRNLKNLFVLFYCLIGMFLIGLRAPLFSFVFSFILVCFLLSRKMANNNILEGRKQFKYIIGTLVLCIAINEIVNNKFVSFYQSVYNDMSTNTEMRQNTFKGREIRAMQYQIPMALQHPYFGLGFIYKDTPAAKKYKYNKYTPNRVRDLYNMDFGYGTLWITFGLFGAVIILFCFVRAIFFIYIFSRKILSPSLIQLVVVMLAFIICNYTWAVLRDALGLIILAFSTSIANEEMMKLKEHNTSDR